MDGEIGNGRATAILLARHGAKVALLDYNVDWAKDTKRMIDEEGGISEVIQTDVTKEESCKAAVNKTLELFGAVHISALIMLCCCSRSWRSHGRRNSRKPRCMGARLSYQRHEHGTHESVRHPRNAEARERINCQHVLR